jgi:hypothetical protein
MLFLLAALVYTLGWLAFIAITWWAIERLID